MVRTALFLLLAAAALPAAAQDAAAYVSRLTAQPGPTSVLLTWKDAEWPDATYEIWRSEKEIVRDSLSQAKLLATVKSGVEAYEDTTVAEPSFYLVLLKDKDGLRRSFYIPYRNKTSEAVKPSATDKSTARVKVGSVSYANPQVLVSFTATPADRKLVVFRRAAPITAFADLKDATLLGNTMGTQAPYRDTPPPGLEFYYAILDAQAFADGKPDAFQIENTVGPAGFPLVALSADTKLDDSLRPGLGPSTRALPLPLLQVETDPGSGSPLASTAYDPIEAKPLSAGADKALKTWSKASLAGPSEVPSPVVLPEERSAAQTGAGRYLVQIQKSYMEPKDWKGAVTALETVLKLELEPRTAARARFYLGESLAYLKDYKSAYLEFLMSRGEYPAESTPFLESLLSLLEASSD